MIKEAMYTPSQEELYLYGHQPPSPLDYTHPQSSEPSCCCRKTVFYIIMLPILLYVCFYSLFSIIVQFIEIVYSFLNKHDPGAFSMVVNLHIVRKSATQF